LVVARLGLLVERTAFSDLPRRSAAGLGDLAEDGLGDLDSDLELLLLRLWRLPTLSLLRLRPLLRPLPLSNNLGDVAAFFTFAIARDVAVDAFKAVGF
jgi:hypothetical protein